MGAMEQARKTVKAIKDVHPEFSLTAFAANHPSRDQKHLDRILTHLNQVELPAR
jgi:hypothetical protein